jgi:hypothetical protein
LSTFQVDPPEKDTAFSFWLPSRPPALPARRWLPPGRRSSSGAGKYHSPLKNSSVHGTCEVASNSAHASALVLDRPPRKVITRAWESGNASCYHPHGFLGVWLEDRCQAFASRTKRVARKGASPDTVRVGRGSAWHFMLHDFMKTLLSLRPAAQPATTSLIISSEIRKRGSAISSSDFANPFWYSGSKKDFSNVSISGKYASVI